MLSIGKTWFCVALCLVVGTGTALTGTVYDNFGPGSGGFEYSWNESWFIAGFGSGFDYVETAQVFTPSASGDLTDIYLGLGKVLSLNQCTVQLVLDNGSGPPLAEDVMETWVLYDLPSLYLGEVVQLVSVEQPYLTAGQSYWIRISVDDGSSAGWGRNVTGATGHIMQYVYDFYEGFIWVDVGYDWWLSAMRVDVAGGPETVSASMSCTPSSGTVPFSTQFSLQLENLYDGERRRMAAHIDVNLANGQSYTNWRAGNTVLQASSNYYTSWNQNLPAIGAVIGMNTFTLVAQDVTPAPYNQPPYPASGDTDTATCTVEGIAP